MNKQNVTFFLAVTLLFLCSGCKEKCDSETESNLDAVTTVITEISSVSEISTNDVNYESESTTISTASDEKSENLICVGDIEQGELEVMNDVDSECKISVTISVQQNSNNHTSTTTVKQTTSSTDVIELPIIPLE